MWTTWLEMMLESLPEGQKRTLVNGWAQYKTTGMSQNVPPCSKIWPHTHIQEHTYTHTSLCCPLPICWGEHMHRIDLIMIMRLLRTSDVRTNVCCAARASRCQHAGSWHAIKKNISRNDTRYTHCWKKTDRERPRLWPWMAQLQPVCESMHGRDRAGMRAGGGANECMQKVKAVAGALKMKPPRPGRGLTSRFVGVFDCHKVGIHLYGLGREARWVERPRLASERHP